MSNVPKLTLRGLYDYTDGGIFEHLIVPEGVVKQEFINRLLFTRGELGVLFPDPDWLTEAIGSWSVNWISNFTRIKQTLEAQYNPIHNFDRNELYTDTEGIERSGSSSASGSIDTDVEGKVSAYNETTYQPDSKSISGTESSSEDESEETVDRTLQHAGHLYGNIGITKSQEMVDDEVSLRIKLGLFDIMADVFAQELLLLVY